MELSVVSVAQRLEHWTVAPGVEGSNPFTHPSFSKKALKDEGIKDAGCSILLPSDFILVFGMGR
jgi:hypothetical protein